MKETPLITFTKADDSGCGTREPGDLDFLIHGDALSRWLSSGHIDLGEHVGVQAARLATELRAMADSLISGVGPAQVSVEMARARFAERVRESMRRTNTDDGGGA